MDSCHSTYKYSSLCQPRKGVSNYIIPPTFDTTPFDMGAMISSDCQQSVLKNMLCWQPSMGTSVQAFNSHSIEIFHAIGSSAVARLGYANPCLRGAFRIPDVAGSNLHRSMTRRSRGHCGHCDRFISMVGSYLSQHTPSNSKSPLLIITPTRPSSYCSKSWFSVNPTYS
jgi:hypothetical protein